MNAFREYERKLHLLRWLNLEGRQKSKEYELLLCEMNTLWGHMEPHEQDLMHKLSAALISADLQFTHEFKT